MTRSTFYLPSKSSPCATMMAVIFLCGFVAQSVDSFAINRPTIRMAPAVQQQQQQQQQASVLFLASRAEDLDDEDRRREYARVGRRSGRRSDNYYDNQEEEEDRQYDSEEYYDDEDEEYYDDDDDEFVDDDEDDDDEDFGFFSNTIIPNPLLDSIDPDGAADRFPEIASDFKFWIEMLLFVAFLDFLSAVGPRQEVYTLLEKM